MSEETVRRLKTAERNLLEDFENLESDLNSLSETAAKVRTLMDELSSAQRNLEISKVSDDTDKRKFDKQTGSKVSELMTDTKQALNKVNTFAHRIRKESEDLIEDLDNDQSRLEEFITESDLKGIEEST